MRLRNKVALLAGIGQGMGKATALLFAQEGAKVALAARTDTAVKNISDRIQSSGGDALVVTGDLSIKSETERIVGEVIEKFGRLDIVYSAAGGNFDPSRNLADVDDSFWGTTIDNTLNSLFNLAQIVHPVMKEQRSGAIVAVAASDNVRQAGNPAYGTAKSGVIGLCKNLAVEFHKDNIRVNTINAGLFRGSLEEGPIKPAALKLHRTGFPQDIAYAALFLASNESGWITGQTITVDGGVDVGTRPLWEYER